ncbi:MAG: biopolymer transporter ExbD [Planctomycetaceae bacterium]
MPIRFRCPQCRQLSGIATRKAGSPVQCPRCQARIIVPLEDMGEATFDPAASDIEAEGAEAQRSPSDAPDATDEDEWGRVRWESDEAWDDEHVDEENAAAFASEEGEMLDLGWDDDDAPAETQPPPETRHPLATRPAAESRRPFETHQPAEVRPSGSAPAKPPPPRKPAYLAGGEGDDELIIRRMKSDVDEMDLTPMVDCTFLLLIFFMITASFSLQKTIEVPPPNPDKKGAAQSLQTLDDFKEDSIIVEIDERNAILIDDEPLTALASLPQVLTNKMLLEKKTELMLMAHDKAWHEIVVAVIDSANEVGMQRIRMAAHSGSDD